MCGTFGALSLSLCFTRPSRAGLVGSRRWRLWAESSAAANENRQPKLGAVVILRGKDASRDDNRSLLMTELGPSCQLR